VFNLSAIPIWKTAPFLRLLAPFITGIIAAWYLHISFNFIITEAIGFGFAYFLFHLLPLSIRFGLQFVQGLLLNLILFTFGLFICWQNDIRQHQNWYGLVYHDSDFLTVRISEPLTQKTKSYKTEGFIEAVINRDGAISCKGKIMLYFAKDSISNPLHYGDKILIRKNLRQIKNPGNPGAFNYQQYAAFQQTFHSVFLKENDWVLLNEKSANLFWKIIYRAKEKILSVLQQYVSSGKDELGIAEALLIGYTNDLDKDIVQAYSNTGVVHIIAISGMHLGLIYVLLLWISGKIPGIKRSKGLQLLLTLTCLWMFSLLSGGGASVLRSAVMFTIIAIGKTFFTQSSIYNSLAASAFIMLCYNPYYLWDVGFQLSYLAVAGIVIFQNPVYHIIFIKNKRLDAVWKMVAITTAAQVLTFPVCVYYFHQFPVLFLITNLIAIPLSTILLYAEIFLVAFSWLPLAAACAGKVTGWLVWGMNTFIVWVNHLSFAVWNKIPATIFSTFLLYAVVICTAAWLLTSSRPMLRLALCWLAAFIITHGIVAWHVQQQKMIIVYNIPQHCAIDFVQGSNYRFIGDSVLKENGLLQQYNLTPGRVALQLNHADDTLQGLLCKNNFYHFGNKTIVLIDSSTAFEMPVQKIPVDMILFSHNPKTDIPQLAAVFDCTKYIFDASNSLWKIGKWKQDCIRLNLRFHSIPDEGGLVVELQ
jgi:competence protein ComEC